MVHRQFLFILCMLLSLSWTGCGKKAIEPRPVIIETAGQATIVLEGTPTLPSPTSTRVRRSTTTPLPPTVTLAPVPEFITPTMGSTLTREGRQTYLIEHFSDNSNCELPCWLGIRPGKTTWQEAYRFLSYIGINRMSEEARQDGSIFHGIGGFGFEKPSLYQQFSIIEHKELVKEIRLVVEIDENSSEFQKVWSVYSLHNIIRSYGSPSRVWLSTYSGQMGTEHSYDITIAYDQRGTIIHYAGWLSRSGANFRICPQFDHEVNILSIEIYLQSPDDTKSLESPDNLRDPGIISRSKRIYEASGKTEEQFSELFIQNEKTACFNSPVNIWPEFLTP